MKTITSPKIIRTIGAALSAICLSLATSNAQWIGHLWVNEPSVWTPIYYESFSGARSDLLNGKVPDISLTGAAWQAGNLLFQDGHWDTVVAGSANGQAAWLPITIVPGQLYKVETVALNAQPNWIASGFFSLYPANSSAIAWSTTTWQVRHSNSGYIWALHRNNPGANDQQAFVGYGTANAVGAINGDILSPTLPMFFKSILDTTVDPWTWGIYLSNGVASVSAWGTVPAGIRSDTLVVGGTLGIRGVGLSYERNATANAGADIDYFLVAVPEPSVFALIGLAGLLTILRFRRRK